MMKIGARPTNEQILAALKRAAGGSYAPTAVVKNWLADREFGQFDDLRTSHVLYRLKKLERAGKVREVSSRAWSTMKCWEIV